MFGDLGKPCGPTPFPQQILFPVDRARFIETTHVAIQDLAKKLAIPPHLLAEPSQSSYRGPKQC